MGKGDACDPDDDADGVPDVSDNCPTLANPDQANADGDGLGDACDDDADGDGVANSIDNCQWTANVDQADSDLDGWGDLCDDDDDDDGVPDQLDNCPLVPNPDQSDLDGDGSGDTCDGDTDGDQVPNAVDACPATSRGVPVGPDGCSGLQYVALQCDPDEFANHGRYVSCVARAATLAVERGLLTAPERSVIVSQAAKSK